MSAGIVSGDDAAAGHHATLNSPFSPLSWLTNSSFPSSPATSCSLAFSSSIPQTAPVASMSTRKSAVISSVSTSPCALAEADVGDVGLGVVGELHGRPSEELDENGDDEPVAILADSIGFHLFRVERPVPPRPGAAEVAAEGGAAVLGGVGLAGLDGGDGLGLGGAALGEAGARRGDGGGRAGQLSIFSALMNASCGISTLPNWRIFFLPAFCLSRSLRLRVASPP